MSDTEPNPEPETPPPAATLSQEQVDRLVGRTRTDTRATTEREVLAKLGFESMEEAEQAHAERQAQLEAEKSDLQRAQEEAAQARAAAAEAEMKASQASLQVRIDRTLLESGVPINTLPHVSKMIETSPDASDEEIAETVETLKKDVPQLFATPDDGASRAPSGVPKGGTGGKTKKPTPKTGLQAGHELYESMFGGSD
jgi:multidrug efflux pump subunit AcrA (membrane-fusion protein)